MEKKILNVLGILLSILLSLVLLVMLIITPVISGATKLAQKETLHSMVESIDLSGVFASEEEDVITLMVNSEFFKDMMDLYVDNLLAELDGEPREVLTVEALKDLKETHEDELMEIMRSLIEVEAEGIEVEGIELEDIELEDIELEEVLTDEFVSESLDEFFEEFSAGLVGELPTLEELGVSQEVLTAIQMFRSKQVQNAAIVAIVALSLMIFGCRFVRFKGFMWLAVVNVLACPVVVVIRGALGLVVEMFLTEDLMGMNGVIEPILNVLRNSMMKCVVIYGVCAVVYVVAFVVGRKLVKKNVVAEV